MSSSYFGNVFVQSDLIMVTPNIMPDYNEAVGTTTTFKNTEVGDIVLTLPNSTTNLIGDDTPDIITNKDITSNTNLIRATQLATIGDDVDVSGSAPPQAGYVLIATDSMNATWQLLPDGNVFIENEGNGANVFDETVGSTSFFRRINGNNGVQVIENELDITVQSILSGNNLGSGEGIFSDREDEVLNFKSIFAGNNVVVSTTADEILISVDDFSGNTTGTHFGDVEGGNVSADMLTTNVIKSPDGNISFEGKVLAEDLCVFFELEAFGNLLVAGDAVFGDDIEVLGNAQFNQKIIGNEVCANLIGDTTGTHTGPVVGDVTGALTGDSFGAHTGPVVGDVEGNLVGESVCVANLQVDLIESKTGDSIIIDDSVEITEDLVVLGNLEIMSDLMFGNLTVDRLTADEIYGNTFGKHTGSVCGDVEGNVVGSLTGNSFGTHTGPVVGDVQGNLVGDSFGKHTGPVCGDVEGNVVGTLTGDSFGIHKGSVIGDVEGNLVGESACVANLQVDLIEPKTGDTVVFDGSLEINQDLVVLGNLEIMSDLMFGNLTVERLTADEIYGNTFGKHTGPVCGDVEGNVVGTLTGDSFGTHTGSVIGPVDGNVVGTLTGDSFGTHTGLVIGNTIGTHIGPVIGDVQGNLNGQEVCTANLQVDLVEPKTGDSITIDGSLEITQDLTVLGNLEIMSDLMFGNLTVERLTADEIYGNSFGKHTGPVCGDVQGNVFGTLTGDSFGTHNGPVFGDLAGNTSGFHFGPVEGNVVGTLTGDSFGKHTGPVCGNVEGNVVGTLTGDTNGIHTGPVIGDVEGNLIGQDVCVSNLQVDLIEPKNGDTVTLDGSLEIIQDLVVLGNLEIMSDLTFGNLTVDRLTADEIYGNTFGKHTGPVCGDVEGNVVGTLTGDSFGTHTGLVIGDVQGNLTGQDVCVSNLQVDFVEPKNGDSITIDGSLEITQDLTVLGNLEIMSDLMFGNLTVENLTADKINGNTFGKHTGPVCGDLEGNVVGSLIGDSFGIHTGPVIGDVQGNLVGDEVCVSNIQVNLIETKSGSELVIDSDVVITGNLSPSNLEISNLTVDNLTGNTFGKHTGPVCGDVEGNLTGDSFGTHIGDVLGNLIGDNVCAGNIQVDVVEPKTGDTVNVNGSIEISQDLTVLGNLEIMSDLMFGNLSVERLNADAIYGNSFGKHTGPVCGDVEGNLLGDSFGTHFGPVVGDVQGNLMGQEVCVANIQVDIIESKSGSEIVIDSDVLIIGNLSPSNLEISDLTVDNLIGNTFGKHTGPVCGDIEGNVVGTVIGDVEGNLIGQEVCAGNLQVDLIESKTGDSITLDGSLEITQDLSVLGNLEIMSDLMFGNLSVERLTADEIYGNTFGKHTGPVCGDVEGNVVGTLTGDSFGTHTGPVIGDVNGNINGTLVGDSFGTHTGPVIGDVQGNLIGQEVCVANLQVDILDPKTDESIILDGSLEIAQDLTVLGNLEIMSDLMFGNITVERLNAEEIYGNTIGKHTGPVCGDVEGNVTGDSFGTHTGPVVGDVKGNVTGDSFGTHTGPVIGDVQGNLIGQDVCVSNLQVDMIEPKTGDDIILNGSLQITQDLTVLGNLEIMSDLMFGNLTVDRLNAEEIYGNTFGKHTGPVCGNVEGNVTGTLTGDSFGTHTGSVEGDVTGNTFGVHIGPVIGDVQGNLIGDSICVSNIQVDFIEPKNGSDIVINADVQINGNLSPSNLEISDLTVDNMTVIDSIFGNTFGKHTGFVCGDVEGNVVGTLTGDSFGTHTGAVFGDVEGNVAGTLTGDSFGTHTGPVLGDLTGNTTGSHIGPVIGDVQGNLIGQDVCVANLQVDLIESKTGDTITIGGSLEIIQDLTVLGNLEIMSDLMFGNLSVVRLIADEIYGNTFGKHTGPVCGDVEGNVVGTLTGDTFGTHTGPVFGDVLGNTIGSHFGPVLGDVQGNVVGDSVCVSNLQVDFIEPKSGSDIVIDSDVVITGNLSPSNLEISELTVDNLTVINSIFGNTFGQHTGNMEGNLVGDSFGKHTGPVCGDVEGNVMGTLTGDSFGTHTGPVVGDLTGNTTGSHTGPVTGDVEGNVIGVLTGDSFGAHTGPVIGDIQGNVIGQEVCASNLQVDLIEPKTNDTITIDGSVEITQDLLLLGNLEIMSDLMFGNLTVERLNADEIYGNTFGKHTGPLCGDVEGNVVGTLTGDSFGTHTGPVFGEVEGNVVGSLTGDSFGTHTGPTIGDVQGNLIGDSVCVSNLQVDFIEPKNGSDIVINADVQINGNLSPSNLEISDLTVDNLTVIDSIFGNTFGTHTGPVVGDVEGNVVGTLTGDSFGTHTGSVIGDVTGNTFGTHTGPVVGDVQGNVIGEIVCADIIEVDTIRPKTGDTISIESELSVTGNVSADSFVGDLTGNSAGTHTGDIFTDNLTASPGGDIFVTGNILPSEDNEYVLGNINNKFANIVTQDLVVCGNIFVTGNGIVGDVVSISKNARLVFSSGYVTLNGGTTIVGTNLFNSSVVRNGVGDYSITFTEAADIDDYEIFLQGEEPTGTLDDITLTVVPTSRATTGFSFRITEQDNGGTAGVPRDRDFSFQVLQDCPVVTEVVGAADLLDGNLTVDTITANTIVADNFVGNIDLTGNNLGLGAEVFSDKTGNLLNFRTLVAGNNISIVQSTDEIEISSVGGGAAAKFIIPILTTQESIGAGGGSARGYTIWENSRLSGFTTNEVVLWVVPSSGGRDLTVSLLNNGGATLGSITIVAGSATGFYSFSFTPPTADTRLDLFASRTGGAGPNPQIFAANINLN